MEPIKGQVSDRTKLRVTIVVSRWNEFVTKELLEGALDELGRQGVSNVQIIWVPGTWEIPVAVRKLVHSSKKPDALVALGCILQGQTAHAALLGGDVSSALMNLQVSSGIPIAWGILTPENAEQAIDRAGMKHGNKGREASLAALEMIDVLGKISE